MTKNAKHLIFVFLLLLSSGIAKAQFYGGYSPFMSSYRFWEIDPYKNRFNEIGFVGGFLAPTCEAYYYIVDDNGDVREKKVTGKAKMSFNYGLTIGSGIHLAKIGEKSAIGLNIHMMMTYAKMSISSNELKIKNVGLPFEEKIELFKTSLPISIDFKSGAEAVSDKYLKSMFAFGAGISPRFVSYDVVSGYAVPSISPFLKAEVGYFLGVAFKLRATYFIGEQVWDEYYFYNPMTSNQYGETSYSLTSSGELLISLIVMPYSRTWED